MKQMRASLVHAYTHRPERVLSHFMGNAQVLGNGDVLVGWGGAPYVTEFTREGAIAFDARLPKGGQSYRAFRFPWVGRPTHAPALAARSGVLYASWNGATEVAAWQLREGASASESVRIVGLLGQCLAAPPSIRDATAMPVVGATRVLPESLDDTYKKVRPRFGS